MKIKLVDVNVTKEVGVPFGTCDLCEYVGTAYYPNFIFEVDGEVREVEGWFWSWGDLITVPTDDIIKFGLWLDTKEFDQEFEPKTAMDLFRLNYMFLYDEEFWENYE